MRTVEKPIEKIEEPVQIIEELPELQEITVINDSDEDPL